LGDRPLPLLRFAENCPVYFDRHTLSIRQGQLSMYTLDGRLRFELALAPNIEALLLQGKLQEIVLARRTDGHFQLTFLLNEASQPQSLASGSAVHMQHTDSNFSTDWPEYLVLDTNT
jgi:hypothetical protein